MFNRLARFLGMRTKPPEPTPPARALRWLCDNLGDETRREIGIALALYGARDAAALMGIRDLPQPPHDVIAPDAAPQADGGLNGHDTAQRRLNTARFLIAHRLQVIAAMEAMADQLPGHVADDDGRLMVLAAHVEDGNSVLEAGCGKGRFLAALSRRYHDLKCVGADIAPGLLRYVPAGVEGVCAPMEWLPFEDGRFDMAFSVEAVEHATDQERAVAELARVVRPGGRIIVIDKQTSHWGRLETPAWERWPERNEMLRWLARWCDDERSEEVGYNGRPADGLMVAWHGRRR